MKDGTIQYKDQHTDKLAKGNFTLGLRSKPKKSGENQITVVC